MTGSYSDFLQALRMRESSGDYSAVNTLGYLGAYQFGEAALVDLGIVARDGNAFDNDFGGGFTGKLGITSITDFLTTPEAQDAAALEWMPLLWRYLEALDLDLILGHVVADIHLTASGLLAGAHLLGAGGVRDWVQSGGDPALTDGYATPLGEYLSTFGGYEIAFLASATLSGDDTLVGGAGGDMIAALGGVDRVSGKAGDDTLLGGRGRDTLMGNGGSDLLKGGWGRDILRGGRQDDTLEGGRHGDRLNGQRGDDTLTGGGGPDLFIFRKAGGNDTITDFTKNLDTIRFGGLGEASAIMERASQVGDAVVFDFGDGDTLTLLNTTLGVLGDDILV